MATNKRTKTSKSLTIIRPSIFSDEELQKMKSDILKISSSNKNETDIDMKKQRLSCNRKFNVPRSLQCNIYGSNLSKSQSQKRSESEVLVLGEITDNIEKDEKKE